MTQPYRALAVLFLASIAQCQTLTVSPPQVRAGQSAALAWDTAGTPGFVLGYGRVAGAGHATVTPAVTTPFTLVTPTANGFAYATTTLRVTGAKGTDDFPSLSDFDAAVIGTKSGVGYIDFQARVWDFLQGNLGYFVRGDYVPKRPFVTFYTTFKERPDLVRKGESVRGRRIAVAVEITQPTSNAGALTFGVRPLLQYQRRGESTWRPEKNSAVAHNEAFTIKSRLVGIQ